ncbi:MAG: hypothetical protein ACYC3K_03770 [Candidatus Nanopelagicales bacterium]
MSRVRSMNRPAVRAGVVLSVLMLAATMLPALGAQAVEPAPRLPALPTVPDSGRIPATSRSVPAAGSAATGRWTAWSGGVGRSAGTVMSMVPGGGVALLADWNGDGLATPGRYDAGQWFITNAAAGAPGWEARASFGGSPGDVPVMAQLRRRGPARLGIFRSGTWLWQGPDGKVARTDQFGAVGDLPIVGDWDGDGRDDLGVVRGTTWILRITGVRGRPGYLGKALDVTVDRSVRAAVVRFAFGAAGDVPVVGDWDGDGRDDPGVVRAGREWILSQGLEQVRRTSSESHQLIDGEVPLVASQVTPAAGCPTATRRGERYGRATAKEVRRALTPQGTLAIPGNAEILASVQDSLRYVVTNDLTDRLRSRVDRPYYDPLSTHPTQEESVRRSANAALAAAIMLATTSWSDENGISRQQLLDYARWHIRSLACQHGAITPGGWGNGWQSALWAVTAGQAGWLLWPDLSRQERAYVAAMVVSEADYAAARGPRYFRNRLGQELTPGDSQSDEVSWDLMAPALALAMMPRHDNAARWRDSLIAMAIAAFARPDDLRRPQVYNGVRLDIRLPGTNANEDGTVTNHGIVNPDYIQNVQHLWWAASLLRSGGQPVPEALFLNADIVYRALAVVEFPSPPYAAPGGTVYQPLGQIYYPMGVSWGVRRPATFVGVDGFANAYAAPDVRAGEFLAAHAADTRALQLRWTDGHIYADGPGEDSYRLGREEYALQQLALAWWAGAVKDGLRMRVDTAAHRGISLGIGTPIP